MQLTRSLYRNSVFFFVGFVFLVVLGFWDTYYSNPLQVSKGLVQIHGLLMTAWCGMIIGQAYLIRSNRRELHSVVGKASFIIAPAVFVSMVAVTLAGVPTIDVLFQ